MSTRILFRAWLPLLVVAVAVCAPTDATTTSTSSASEHGVATNHAIDARDLECFFDSLVPYALGKSDIAGMALAIVQNEQVLFAKGYGYADVVTHRPMSPTETLVRPGSITKLFTFTAVMQLIEQGKLNLDHDINEYLDFHIPDTFKQPITLRSLMTHTAGFEESLKEVFVRQPTELPSLRDYVRRNLPRRVFPPGTILAYSNYGAALAGYIVERRSGMPYASYVHDFILAPLQMNDTTFDQPLPESAATRLSQGYLTASSRLPKPFELIGATPAGGMTTSVSDLTHFAIAQLQEGAFRDTRILRAETARLMHSSAFRPATGLNGYALGFYEESRNGVRIIGHGGDTELFHSDLHLISPANLAIVMAFNSNGANGQIELVRTQVFRTFLDRYFPYTPIERPTYALAHQDAARVTGTYELSRRNTSSFLSLLSLFQTMELTAAQGDELRFSFFTDLAGEPKRWREVGPLLYQEENGQALLKFITDASGRVRYFISDDFLPVFVYMPTSLSPLGSLVLLGAATLILVFTVIVWPASAIVRRVRGRALDIAPYPRRLRLSTRLATLLGLGLLLAWASVIGQAASSLGVLTRSLDPYLTILYAAAWLFFALTALTIWNAWRAWAEPTTTTAQRCISLAIALACAVLCWFIVRFHLSTFGAPY